MSTKVTIKWRTQTPSQPGFHLYDDALDSFGAKVGSDERPIYLRIDGVPAELQTLPAGGASVTLALPRELARELGLVPRGTTGLATAWSAP